MWEKNRWRWVFTDTLVLINHKSHLPVLARLLPKLKTVPVVVAVPKHPTLKLTAAGLAFKPNPPKLNPPAVVFPAPSPPNPAASRGRQQRRENDMRELNDKRSGLIWPTDCLQEVDTGQIECPFVPPTDKTCLRYSFKSQGCIYFLYTVHGKA